MGETAVPEVIPWRIQEWFPDIDSKTISSLRKFFDLIIENQKNYNLFILPTRSLQVGLFLRLRIPPKKFMILDQGQGYLVLFLRFYILRF